MYFKRISKHLFPWRAKQIPTLDIARLGDRQLRDLGLYDDRLQPDWPSR